MLSSVQGDAEKKKQFLIDVLLPLNQIHKHYKNWKDKLDKPEGLTEDDMHAMYQLQGFCMFGATIEYWQEAYRRSVKVYNTVLECTSVDLLYIELCKLQYDLNRLYNKILISPLPFIKVKPEESFIKKTEIETIQTVLQKMPVYVSRALVLILPFSGVCKNEKKEITFVISTGYVMDYFLRVQRENESLSQYDNDEVREKLALYHTSMDVFTKMLSHPSKQLPTSALEHIELLLKLNDYFSNILKELKTESKAANDDATASVSTSVSALTEQLSECTISTLAPTMVKQFTHQKKASKPKSLSWSEKLAKFRDLIEAIETKCRPIGPRELMNFVKILGGQCTPTKSGMCLKIPKTSSSAPLTAGFHMPHKGRKGEGLPSDLIDIYKQFLKSNGFTSEKLWPSTITSSSSSSRRVCR